MIWHHVIFFSKLQFLAIARKHNGNGIVNLSSTIQYTDSDINSYITCRIWWKALNNKEKWQGRGLQLILILNLRIALSWGQNAPDHVRLNEASMTCELKHRELMAWKLKTTGSHVWYNLCKLSPFPGKGQWCPIGIRRCHSDSLAERCVRTSVPHVQLDYLTNSKMLVYCFLFFLNRFSLICDDVKLSVLNFYVEGSTPRQIFNSILSSYLQTAHNS